jgi:hypothetical protein
MLQSGHVLFDTPNWEAIAADYRRLPVKPALDGEPNYEDHPVDPYLRQWQPEFGRYSDYDVRKQAYRSVFSGACGHTYGHHAVWQFWSLRREPVNFPMPPWEEAIWRPGAGQLIHLKNLVLSKPYFSRLPAQEMLPEVQPAPPVGDLAADRYNPERASYPAATRDAEGRYAFVYFPLAGQRLLVDLRPLGARVRSAWYDPRSGATHPLGEHANERVPFTSPLGGPDWVLRLDAGQDITAEPQ